MAIMSTLSKFFERRKSTQESQVTSPDARSDREFVEDALKRFYDALKIQVPNLRYNDFYRMVVGCRMSDDEAWKRSDMTRLIQSVPIIDRMTSAIDEIPKDGPAEYIRIPNPSI